MSTTAVPSYRSGELVRCYLLDPSDPGQRQRFSALVVAQRRSEVKVRLRPAPALEEPDTKPATALELWLPCSTVAKVPR